MTKTDPGAIIHYYNNNIGIGPMVVAGEEVVMLSYQRIQRFVERCRRRKGGCRDCGKTLPQGLYLRGRPSLSEMARGGTSMKELKAAMRERGWYCRGCVNRQKRMSGATTSSLRDQFATQEEYYAYLEKHRPPPRAQAQAPPPIPAWS